MVAGIVDIDWVSTIFEVTIVVPLVVAGTFFFYKKVNKFECFDYDLYIDKLLYSPDIRKHYSVPFSWTYPSKRRGMSIQLKVPLI